MQDEEQGNLFHFADRARAKKPRRFDFLRSKEAIREREIKELKAACADAILGNWYWTLDRIGLSADTPEVTQLANKALQEGRRLFKFYGLKKEDFDGT